MPDIQWEVLDRDKALALISDMEKLSFSCFYFRYWGYNDYPLIKMDVTAKRFFKNAEEL